MKKYLFNTAVSFRTGPDKLFRKQENLGHSKSNFLLAQYGMTKGVMFKKLPSLVRFYDIEMKIKQYMLSGTPGKRLRENYAHENNFNIWNYKAVRRSFGLPSNGQRTHSNAKTIKRLMRKRVLINQLARAKIVGAHSKKGK